MIIESQAVGPFMKNGFVVGCEETREAVIIDPGDEVQSLLSFVQQQQPDGPPHPADPRARRSRDRRRGGEEGARRAGLSAPRRSVPVRARRGVRRHVRPAGGAAAADRQSTTRRLRSSPSAGSKRARTTRRDIAPAASVCRLEQAEKPAGTCSSATRCSPDRSAAPTCRAATTPRSSGRSAPCSSRLATRRSSIRATVPTRPSGTNGERIRFLTRTEVPRLSLPFSTVSSIRPTRRRSPLPICARSTRLSFTNVPFVLARSWTSRFSSPAVRRQCRRETSARSTMKSARAARPMVLMAPGLSRNVNGVSSGPGVSEPWRSDLERCRCRIHMLISRASFCSQLTIAVDTSALTRLSFRLGYSSASPVVAGTSR